MQDLEGDGYTFADISLASHQCDHINEALSGLAGPGRGGVRNLIAHPTVVQLLRHERLGNYIWSLIGRELVAVKATLFDKIADTDWHVQWHQDRVVPVKERLEVAGYGPWTTKAGVLHVDPPHEVLAQMIAVRIHLDACGAEDGPIRVIPGSHRAGKLVEEELAAAVAAGNVVELNVPQGSILIMRPLLVHSASIARSRQHRRVLHIELAPVEAISPLQWHSTVQLRRAA